MTIETEPRKVKIKCELYNDNFQNRKKYNIPRAQLVVADIPYNLGNNAFASNPSWYVGGDNKKGESKLAGKQFFPSDKRTRQSAGHDYVLLFRTNGPADRSRQALRI